MGLRVISPGVFTTVQDHGRVGYREWGVPAGGAFDREASDLANALLGNDPDCSTLELTMWGGVYEACETLAIAWAGAPMSVTIAGRERGERRFSSPQSRTIFEGETLSIGGTPSGARMYLAVAGGWGTPLVLGSRSSDRPLTAGTLIPASRSSTPGRSPAEATWRVPTEAPLRVIEGPDASRVDGPPDWLDAEFLVGKSSDRMGLRLEGPAPSLSPIDDRPSMPVVPGAIQVAGGGLLVLGVDGGTIGGYPHVANVIAADLGRLGQLRPSDRVRFWRVSLEEARRIDRIERQRCVDRLRRIAALAADRGPFARATGEI